MLLKLMRRRRRRRNNVSTGPEDPAYEPVQTSGDEKKKQALLPPARAADAGLELGQFLLDAKADGEIQDELRALGHLIAQHVENNYHSRAVQLANSTASANSISSTSTSSASNSRTATILAQNLATANVGFAPGAPATLTARLALDPQTRGAALRYVISRAVLGTAAVVDAPAMPDGDDSSSSSIAMQPPPPPAPMPLLPVSVVAFARELPPVERHRGNPAGMCPALPCPAYLPTCH